MTRPAWVIDRRNDLLWLIGSPLLSYAFLTAHLALGIAAVPLWWAWVVAFDGPHIFATLSRTYLDRTEWASRRGLLLGSLVWFAVGPACFAVSALLGTRLPLDVFFTVALLWAYWHVVRQHYGVLALYKRKASDHQLADNRFDSALLYGGLGLPFVAFALTNVRTRQLLGLPGAPTWETSVALVAWAGVAVVVLAFAARQWDRKRRGLSINTGKLLFLAAILPPTWLLFSPWIAPRVDFALFVIVVTVLHNVQYLAIVWFYHRNRYHSGAALAAFGLAPRVSAHFALFMLAGVAFTLVYRLAGCALGSAPGCHAHGLGALGPPGATAADLAGAFFWGFALHHYWVDQKIWRPSKDAGLRRDLNLRAAAS